jgi:hypothetical protein
MKGDFSRLRFSQRRQYTSVLTQQGRVQLDSDANEQRAIDAYIRKTEAIDIVGQDGAPKHDAGFAISLVGSTSLSISPGRYYVNGLLCENDAALDYAAQPFLINPATNIRTLLTELLDGKIPAIQIWLEAWPRLVTALDDPCIKDVALGEADTTARVQTVWRVVAVPAPVQANQAQQDCCAVMRQAPFYQVPGKLTATTGDAGGQGSCLPSPHAAYRGLENQLYRVEIHEGGTAAASTFKWSRENGSVVTKIIGIAGTTVTVDSLGPDANLGFAPLQWVELTDDSYEFGQTPDQPGQLIQIQSIVTEHNQIILASPAPSLNTYNGHAKLRRWDQTGPGTSGFGVSLQPGTQIGLENGISVQFSADGWYDPGDHWLIPARTATGNIEWPPCDSDGATYQWPHRTAIERTGIACIHVAAGTRSFTVEDCRQIFLPLVDLTPAAAPAAMHVTAINWRNDDVMTADQFLATPLTVTLDTAPAAGVDTASFTVALEFVLFPEEQNFFAANIPPPAASGPVGGGGIRWTFILDGNISVSGTNLTWTLPPGEVLYTTRLLEASVAAASEKEFVRARVTLKGRNILANATATHVYLDGQAYGTPGTRADGTTRTDLTLPSGDNDRASDLESWFYIAPTPVVSVTVTPAKVAFVADATGVTKLVDGTGTATPAASQAAITASGLASLNYPALLDTIVSLSIAGGATGVVTIPATVTIPKGAVQQTFALSVVRNPGAGVQNYTVTATIRQPSGQTNSATAPFSVTGSGTTIISQTSIDILSPGLLNTSINQTILNPGTTKS